jgi:hypothetical protein
MVWKSAQKFIMVIGKYRTMKRIQILLTAAGTAVLVLGFVFLARAQAPAASQRFEVAMIKWDGPDKIQLITPQKSEFIRVFKSGVQLPNDMNDEAFCLNWAANRLAQEGWEPVNLNSTRILMRRPVNR